MIVADEHQFHMLETHIRPIPVFPVSGGRDQAFRGAGRLEREKAGEVRLADKCRVISGAAQAPGKAFFAGGRVEVDAVIVNPMCPRKLTCQDGSSGGLTDHAGGDGVFQPRALAAECVKMRRRHAAAGKPVTVAALLVRGDEQQVRAIRIVHLPSGSTWGAFFKPQPSYKNGLVSWMSAFFSS